MNALVGGLSQRNISTSSVLHRRKAISRKMAHLRSQPVTLPRLCLGPFNGARGDDHDVLERSVLVPLAPAGLDCRDFVDRVHAFGDPTEDGVAVIARAVV